MFGSNEMYFILCVLLNEIRCILICIYFMCFTVDYIDYNSELKNQQYSQPIFLIRNKKAMVGSNGKE